MNCFKFVPHIVGRYGISLGNLLVTLALVLAAPGCSPTGFGDNDLGDLGGNLVFQGEGQGPSIRTNGETYLQMTIGDRQELTKLTRLLSIDNVRGNYVWAYASSRQLEKLRALGYVWRVLPHPGINPGAKMGLFDRAGRLQWDRFPTYSEYVTAMQQFVSSHPTLCRLYDIGSSSNQVQPHNLWVLKISKNPDVEEDEPEVFFSSSIHGDETVGYMLLLRLIDDLLSGYGTDSEITNMIDNMEIWINPASNPDGTYYSGDGTVDGAIRGYVDANGEGTGVDPNRNFSDPVEGDHPDGESWAPETVAMMNFISSRSFVISANFHGGAEVVNYPWDCQAKLHVDDAWMAQTSRAYADLCHANGPSGYMTDLDNGITNGYAWYQVNGGRQDYMTYFHGGRDVTLEVSSVKNPPGSSMPTFWSSNRQALLTYLQNSLAGVRGLVTSPDGSPLSATITVLGHDTAQDRSFVSTDPDRGDYHRMLLPGTYNLRFTSEGYIPQDHNGVAVSGSIATRVDVVLTPAARTNVFGRVISLQDHQPVAGATVEIQSTSTRTAVTDRSGYFLVKDIPENAYRFHVIANHFETLEEDRTVTVATSRQDFSLYRVMQVVHTDLETDNGGLVASGTPTPGWQWGVPEASVGAVSGQKTWGTVLSGPYADNANWTLDLLKVQVPKLNPKLSFWQWYDMESGYDGGQVEFSSDGGQTFELLLPQGGYPNADVSSLNGPGYSGTSGGWVQAVFDLSAHTGQFGVLRFRFTSDGSQTRLGWYLDDLDIGGRMALPSRAAGDGSRVGLHSVENLTLK